MFRKKIDRSNEKQLVKAEIFMRMNYPEYCDGRFAVSAYKFNLRDFKNTIIDNMKYLEKMSVPFRNISRFGTYGINSSIYIGGGYLSNDDGMEISVSAADRSLLDILDRETGLVKAGDWDSLLSVDREPRNKIIASRVNTHPEVVDMIRDVNSSYDNVGPIKQQTFLDKIKYIRDFCGSYTEGKVYCEGVLAEISHGMDKIGIVAKGTYIFIELNIGGDKPEHTNNPAVINLINKIYRILYTNRGKEYLLDSTTYLTQIMTLDRKKVDIIFYAGDVEDEEKEKSYLKFYKCYRCDHEWTDEHDCLCDDRCPECDKSNGIEGYIDLINDPDNYIKY